MFFFIQLSNTCLIIVNFCFSKLSIFYNLWLSNCDNPHCFSSLAFNSEYGFILIQKICKYISLFNMFEQHC